MTKIECAGVIFLSNNHIVLEDRRKIKKHGEHWSFFGGRIEEGESPEIAMKREIYEEIGFKILDYEFFNKYTFIPSNKPDLQLTYHMYISKLPNIDNLNIHSRGGIKLFTFKQALRLRITEIDKKIINEVINSKYYAK